MLSVYNLLRTLGVQDMWWVGARWSPNQLLSRNWYSDSICLNSLDENRFGKSILRYVFLAAQTYKLVKM